MQGDKLILFGAGAAGSYVLKAVGRERVIGFVDNDPKKWGYFDGVPVVSPEAVGRFGEGVWVATAIARPAAPEIRAQIARLGVPTVPLWEVLPVCHGLPSREASSIVYRIAGDMATRDELTDQVRFRECPNYDDQRPPSSVEELYFPAFIKKRDDENFVDCGAADGDTVKVFASRWDDYELITAFEPDRGNFAKLRRCPVARNEARWSAVSDFDGIISFTESGDYSAHVAGCESRDDKGGTLATVPCAKLDSSLRIPPTYIKMDIEGSELEALWGARKLIKQHSPVLAICAYHTSDHLWQIPLLIHAIQPDYKLFLRRYAEGAFEIVWYAVPAERVI